MEAIEIKKCIKCGEYKPLEEFVKFRGGRARTCKACHRAYMNAYNAKIKEMKQRIKRLDEMAPRIAKWDAEIAAVEKYVKEHASDDKL